jgi:hypothetical protein
MTDETGTHWTYQAAGGGWLLGSNPQGDRVAVRFAKNDAGRWEPRELRMDTERPLDSTALRRVSLTAMESAANGIAAEHLQQRLHHDEPEPWWRPPHLQPGELWMPHRRMRSRLSIPAKKNDLFYQRVAAVYRQRVAESNRPAVEMANANGVPVSTVHRWVKEARRRGFLPPGQKGRRG